MFLLETIKVKNRQLQHIHWHNQRLNTARQKLLGVTDTWNLEALITIPVELSDEIYKCRIIYAHNIEKIEFIPYTPINIQTLKIVYHPTIDYAFKYANRVNLLDLFEQRGNCDDILIIKNGFVTDTYYGNIAFFDGKDWWTPNTPLLKGTHRTMLIEQKVIFEKKILLEDLEKFQFFKVFNAMINWEEQDSIPIEKIKKQVLT